MNNYPENKESMDPDRRQDMHKGTGNYGELKKVLRSFK